MSLSDQVAQPADPSYRQIPLNRGLFALVDEEDFAEISKHQWTALWSPDTKTFYAVRRIVHPNGKQGQLRMHRVIMDAPQGVYVDHIHGATLDNRKSKLRLCTKRQNHMNSKVRSDSRSGIKGAMWDSRKGRWRAEIRVNGKSIYLGGFDNPQDAHETYRKAALIYFGEFARI